MNDLSEYFGEIIFCYTRAQAIEDEVLIDESDLAREAGFTLPLAVTASVWADLDAIPDEQKAFQTVEGRVWDLLVMARFAVKTMQVDSDQLLFKVILHTSESRERTYMLHCCPGDDGEAVLTVMQPGED